MKTKITFPCAGIVSLILCISTASAATLPEKNLPGSVVPNAADAVLRSPANQLYFEANQSMLVSDWATAIPKLKKAVQLDPSLFPAWEQLGWCYWKNDQRDETFRLWGTLRRLNPDLPIAYNLLGRAYTADGQEAKATEAFRKSLQLDPNQDAAQFSIARLSRWEGRYDDSIAILQDQLGREPDRADIRIELARAYLNNWQFDEALPLWEKLSAERPGNAECQIALAECQLKTGDPETAREVSNQLLANDPDHRMALLIMADLSEYGENPGAARPYLRRLIDSTDSVKNRQKLRMRLIMLVVRLNRDRPIDYDLDEAIAQAREFLTDDPKNVDAVLLLGELLMMDADFAGAEEKFQIVLRDFNPANQRAHRGLFETYNADRKFNQAEKELKVIESFNPRDPYLHYLRAKFEASCGRFTRANKALEQLEVAGERGAVLVLLYHGLSNSEWTEVPSVRLFREQLLALQDAGFRFISPTELPEYFAGLEKAREGDDPSEATPDRVAIVTFDDARLDSFRLGTPVMHELGIPMSMHVPIGNVVRSDPFLASWEQLADYQQQGWILGSHLYESSTPVAGDADGTPIRPLASRIWLPDENRMETADEFRQRIQQEYTLSRDLMQAHLGITPEFLAYPMGDIGQETWGNDPDAVWINLQAAATNYQVGFLQSAYGYTVVGDNPLLYQRRELGRYMAPSNTADAVLKTHPVFLARVSQAQLATLEGKQYTATKIVNQLEKDQYPETSLDEIKYYSRSKLSRKFAAPPAVETVRKGPFNLDLSQPYVGIKGDYFSDSLERNNYHVFGFGGAHLTPNIVAEGFAGFGRLKQGEQTTGTNILDEVSVDETTVGMKASFTFPRGDMIAFDYTLRRYDDSVKDEVSAYGVEGQLKPFLPLDIAARFEHDAEPSARTLLRGPVTYDLWMANAVFSLRDWWEIWGSGQYYTFSDDNARTHASVASQWLLWEPIGLNIGLRYAYTSADEKREDYWTPYELNRYYVELSLRRTYMRTFYSLRARAGIGREAIRQQDEDDYQEDVAAANAQVAQAQRDNWPQQDLAAAVANRNAVVADPPDEEWKPAYGLSASIRTKLGKHWELHGEVSYNQATDYDEVSALADIIFRF